MNGSLAHSTQHAGDGVDGVLGHNSEDSSRGVGRLTACKVVGTQSIQGGGDLWCRSSHPTSPRGTLQEIEDRKRIQQLLSMDGGPQPGHPHQPALDTLMLKMESLQAQLNEQVLRGSLRGVGGGRTAA